MMMTHYLVNDFFFLEIVDQFVRFLVMREILDIYINKRYSLIVSVFKSHESNI